MRADRLLVAVDLDHRRVARPARRGASSTRSARRRSAITTSASPSSRCAVGEANPPEMPTANGSPANSPLATAEVARTAPRQLAEPPQRRARAGQHRAAAGDDRGPLGARRARRRPATAPAPGRTGASSGHATGSARLDRRPPARRAAASARPRGARRPRAGRPASTSATAVAGPWTRSATAPTDSTSAAWSILKFERICAAGVSAASSTSGVRIFAASVSPVIAFVSPGPWCTRRDAEPPADPRVAVGHAQRAGLVAGREEAPAGGDDRVRHGQIAAPHQAEDDVAAEAMQGLADRLRTQTRRATVPLRRSMRRSRPILCSSPRCCSSRPWARGRCRSCSSPHCC